MKRVIVRRALVMLVVIAALVLPFNASADYYFNGHVWDITNNTAVKGAKVQLWLNGVMIRESTTVSRNGDWGFTVSGQVGTYAVRLVELPAGLTADNVTVGGQGVPTMDPTEWGLIFTGAQKGNPVVDPAFRSGAVNFNCVNETVTPPPDPVQAPEWMYVHGKVTDPTLPDVVPNPNPLLPPISDPYKAVKGVSVQLVRFLNGDWQPVGGVNVTGDRGLFGMGCSPVPVVYAVRIIGLPAGYTTVTAPAQGNQNPDGIALDPVVLANLLAPPTVANGYFLFSSLAATKGPFEFIVAP